jgi:hypothetical protein
MFPQQVNYKYYSSFFPNLAQNKIGLQFLNF